MARPSFPFEANLATGEIEAEGRRLLDFSSADVLGLGTDMRVREAVTAAVRRFGTAPAPSHSPGTALEAALMRATGHRAAVMATDVRALMGPWLKQFIHKRHSRLDSDLTSALFAHVNFTAADSLPPPDGTNTLTWCSAINPHNGCLDTVPTWVQTLGTTREHWAVDETQSLGLLGSTGQGLREHFGTFATPPLFTLVQLHGTLASSGAVLLGNPESLEAIADALPHGSHLSAPAAAASLKALEIAQSESTRRARAFDAASVLIEGALSLGLDVGPTVTPCVPLWIGEEAKAVATHATLWAAGLSSRLDRLGPHSRITLVPKATHADAQLATVLKILGEHRAGFAQRLESTQRDATVSRPSTFVTSANAHPRWNSFELATPISPAPEPLLTSVPTLSQRVLDAVETFTYRATTLRPDDVRRWVDRRRQK